MTSAIRTGLIGGGIGGAAMFLADPDRGARRRARLRETGGMIARKARDNWPAYGIAAVGAGLALVSLARRLGRRAGDDVDRMDDSAVAVLAIDVIPEDVIGDGGIF